MPYEFREWQEEPEPLPSSARGRPPRKLKGLACLIRRVLLEGSRVFGRPCRNLF